MGGAVGGGVPASNKKEKKARCLYDFEETTKTFKLVCHSIHHKFYYFCSKRSSSIFKA